MSQQAATILRRTRERMSKAREQLATELFERDRVLEIIGAAAAKGQAFAEFAGPPDVSLERTEAAKTIASELTAGGFSTDWQERLPLRPGDPKTFVLVVGWS